MAFIIYAVYSGFSKSHKASQNLEEYFLAGRSLKGWEAGLSMAATQFAADTPLMVMGMIATAGLFSLWRLWIYALSFLLLGFLLARMWRRANVLTDAEFTELRYGEKPALYLRAIKAFYFGTVFNCTVLAMVLLAATRIAEPFLIWNQWLPEGLFGIFESLVTLVGVPLTVNTTSAEVWILSTNNFISLLAIVSVTTLYSTTGGLRSVVATDKLQLLLMLGGTAVFSYIAVDKAGGLAALKTNLDNALAAVPFMDSSKVLSFTPTEKSNAGIGVLLVFALQWLIQINSDGTGYLAQRTMACENEKEAKKAAFVFTFTQILIRSLIWIPLGVALIILYPMAANVVSDTVVSQREFTYVLAMNEILPIGLKGVMVTAMLAALASTVDTHMNWGSSYWSHDFYDRLYCQELKGRKADSKTLVLVARLSNFIILAISLVIMANLGSIKTAWEASLLIGASMGVPLILRWVWWRMSAWAELAGIISSIVLIPLSFVLIDSDASEWRILFVSFFSLVITIATVFFKGPESKQTLERFYNQVKPIGFWGEYGDNSKELFKGIAGMLTCGLSLFCLLVGMGSLLVDSPAPIESNTLWLSLNFLVGFGLIPIWYRLGFK